MHGGVDGAVELLGEELDGGVIIEVVAITNTSRAGS